MTKSDFYQAALKKLAIDPINKREDILSSRLVHDLGIAGDDFQDFFEILDAMRPVSGKIPAKYIPSELSKDAFLVARAHSWLARKSPTYKQYCLKRIVTPQLELRKLDEFLYDT
ncbi:hypothetical protein ABMC88_16890 [Sulfitobacter sp. HNIBRBA2951]|uniref:hypothetical protein n=1 Tax=Sulfitobacter aquimarinus TaxID=3158557 RepID=UPI0032DF86D4